MTTEALIQTRTPKGTGTHLIGEHEVTTLCGRENGVNPNHVYAGSTLMRGGEAWNGEPSGVCGRCVKQARS